MSGSTAFVAEEGVLEQASRTVEQARADVTALAHTLSGQIDAVASKWGGDGARAFAQLHQAWQERQQRVVGALDGLSASLAETGRDTVATDAAQADLAAHLRSRLDGVMA